METDSPDELANHLHGKHGFQSGDAGRIAKHVKYWKDYDEQLSKDI
jgi:hypothetical protein